MLNRLVQLIPPPVVSWLGQAQFRYPALGPVIRRLGRTGTIGEGTIAHGVGKGLRFYSGTNSKPGYLLGTTDPDQQAFLAGNLKPGDIFYDIGAHHGFFAVIGARLVGPEGRVYAFEPFAESADRVRRNAQLNNFQQLSLLQVAVCNTDGSANLCSPTPGESSDKVGLTADAQTGIIVETVSIDRWRVDDGVKPPNLVMIDVEGAEIDVLEGMIGTIKESRPLMQIEVHWLGQRFLDAFDRLLRPLGYTLSNMDGGQVHADAVRWQAVASPA